MKMRTNDKVIVILTLMIGLLLLISVRSFSQNNSDKINIGLIYPLSSNGSDAARDTNKFSLNLICGLSAAEHGFTFAGLFNVIKQGDVPTLQMTGLINVASYVRGSQISGLMNVAKNVKGVQMAGLINIADTADYQIGLINISKNGEKSIAVTYDENQTAMITFRSGVKMFYGILGIVHNFKNDKEVYAY